MYYLIINTLFTYECGFTYIWETENVNNKEWLKCVVKRRLLDQFVQNWQTSLSDSSKALNKGNNKITELRTILQRESQNS